jgi:hypothetical protein
MTRLELGSWHGSARLGTFESFGKPRKILHLLLQVDDVLVSGLACHTLLMVGKVANNVELPMPIKRVWKRMPGGESPGPSVRGRKMAQVWV